MGGRTVDYYVKQKAGPRREGQVSWNRRMLYEISKLEVIETGQSIEPISIWYELICVAQKEKWGRALVAWGFSCRNHGVGYFGQIFTRDIRQCQAGASKTGGRSSNK